jgi:hypothetical protein
VWNFPKLTRLNSALEFLPNAGMRCFSHAARHCRLKNGAVVLYRRPLKDMIPRPRHCPLRVHLRLLHLILPEFPRLGDDSIRLVSILSGQFAVPP